MEITPTTFKLSHLYQITTQSDTYYSVVSEVTGKSVTIYDLGVNEVDLGQTDCEDVSVLTYGDINYIISIIEIGPILTYAEQIKSNYPELLL